jgi:hypothetical protein
MTVSTHTLRRITGAAALATCAAALAVPTALAGGNSGYQDGWYGYAVSLTKASHSKPTGSSVTDGRSPDTKSAALAAHARSAPQGSTSRFGPRDGSYPYAVSPTRRNAATLVDGRSPDTLDAARLSGLTVADGRSPDTRDAALAARTRAAVSVDGRSPDTIDAASLAHSPLVTIVRSPGFDWADFSIGIAAALGAMLLFRLSTTILSSRHSRKTSPVATA